MGGGFTHFLMPLVFDGIKASGSPAFLRWFPAGTLATASADKSSACASIFCCRATWVVVSRTS
jgi:hypothetical protein